MAAEKETPKEPTHAPVKLPEEVVTHPLVLLSIVDHYNRVARDTSKRVVGVLLGSTFHGKCDITNSFAVPFDEDLRNPGIWYLDHDFLENMYQMFKKINAKERIVGFYSSGPKIRKADLDIDDLFRRYCPNPVLVICDVRPNVDGLPTTAYGSVEEVEEDGKAIKRVFKHIKSTVGAYEAEEVGVEHLLRDINDPSVSSLAGQVKHKMTALNGLKERLEEMKTYLENVVAGRLPANHQIIYNMQTIFNLLPNLNVDELVRSMFMKTNDMHFVIYLSSLIRCTIALHNLVNNKIKYKESEEVGFTDKKEEKKEEKKEDKASKEKKSEKAP
ncbi:26S proteasome non-ATPase regulatory subunit 7 [Phytophthora boehmeriae]|uniref:26S proteasome non-ATPase regulatory subunit 7 n=1 Tax=Phytophthora boehmeriae TaxID=109152 RepID=A0A8T1XBE6_9STRA|nr:26S proteasome non-ATPase regulatory subunit 7 [Phytophthora boehmeriae]